MGGRHGDALVVAVSAPAVDGRATRACLDAVAAAFGVNARHVVLVTGATSRTKVLDVSGRPEKELQAKLNGLLGPLTHDG